MINRYDHRDPSHVYPVNTKHLYNIYTMLDKRRRCIKGIQMFCVYWVGSGPIALRISAQTVAAFRSYRRRRQYRLYRYIIEENITRACV